MRHTVVGWSRFGIEGGSWARLGRFPCGVRPGPALRPPPSVSDPHHRVAASRSLHLQDRYIWVARSRSLHLATFDHVTRAHLVLQVPPPTWEETVTVLLRLPRRGLTRRGWVPEGRPSSERSGVAGTPSALGATVAEPSSLPSATAGAPRFFPDSYDFSRPRPRVRTRPRRRWTDELRPLWSEPDQAYLGDVRDIGVRAGCAEHTRPCSRALQHHEEDRNGIQFQLP